MPVPSSVWGLMYDNGQGVLQDYKATSRWFRHAAEQGFAKAWYNLGVMHGNAQGVLQDYAQSVK